MPTPPPPDHSDHTGRLGDPWAETDPPSPPLMRPTTGDERGLRVVVTVAMVGVFAPLAVVLGRDHLRIAGLGIVVMLASAVLGALLEWHRRVDPPQGPRFWALPARRRWALRRALVRGSLGEHADRPYARFWLGRRLRYPANCALLIGMIGWYLAITPTDPPTPLAYLEWAALAPVAVVPLLLRPRWLRLANRVDLADRADAPADPVDPGDPAS